MIYQSGYLTIKGHDERFGIYRLGFPNREVEEGFIRFLLPYYANVNKVESPFEILKFVREVRAGDYESFFRRLQSFFSDIPYELARELELHCQNGSFLVERLNKYPRKSWLSVIFTVYLYRNNRPTNTCRTNK